MRHRHRVARKPIRHLHRMCELRIAGDGVHQEQVRPRQLAGQLRRRRALELLQQRQSHQRRQALPVTRHSVDNDPELQRPKCRRAERLRGIQPRDRHFRGLQRNAAIAHRQRVRKRFVDRRDFDLLVEGERGRRDGAQRERQACILRQLILVVELDIAVIARGRRLDTLAQKLDTGPWRGHESTQRKNASILQCRLGAGNIARLESRRGGGVLSQHRELIAALMSGELTGQELHALHVQTRDFVEASALEHSLRVACVNRETVEVSGFREGVHRHRLGVAGAVLLHQQRQRAWLGFLQWEFDLHLIGLHRFPFGGELFTGRVPQHDVVDTTGAGGLQVDGGLTADDQRTVLRIHRPGLRMGVHEVETRTVVGIKSPITMQLAVNAVAERSLPQGRSVDDEPALLGVSADRQIDRGAIFPRQGELHIVRITGGEHQRRALDRQDQLGFARAVEFLRIDSVQRRQLLLLDRGQRRHENRLRVMKGRRRVERQIERIADGGAERRDVLILRRAERVEDLRDVQHRCDVGTVVAVAQLRREAGFHGQVTGRTGRQGLDNRRAMSVVENESALPLHQAWSLQLRNLVETLLVDLDGETACQQGSGFLQFRGIGGVHRPHGHEVLLQP